jgi:hypothetical protein
LGDSFISVYIIGDSGLSKYDIMGDSFIAVSIIGDSGFVEYDIMGDSFIAGFFLSFDRQMPATMTFYYP